jgi:hypothetical protein
MCLKLFTSKRIRHLNLKLDVVSKTILQHTISITHKQKLKPEIPEFSNMSSLFITGNALKPQNHSVRSVVSKHILQHTITITHRQNVKKRVTSSYSVRHLNSGEYESHRIRRGSGRGPHAYSNLPVSRILVTLFVSFQFVLDLEVSDELPAYIILYTSSTRPRTWSFTSFHRRLNT